MKKIVYVSIIAALSIIMFSAVVSAGDYRWGRFHGVYEMTAKSNCLISTGGFTETADGFIANGPHVWGTADMAYGTWIFKKNGTGTAEGRNFAFDLPPGHPAHGPRARDNDFYFEFEYEITSGGAIHVWVTTPGLTMLEMDGMVSQDRKTMTLNNTYTRLNANTIFMATRVLIQIQNN